MAGATERAGKANERAGNANERAADLETRASKAEVRVAEANARIKEAEQHTAEAQLELAKFRAPRVLKVDKSMFDKLKQFKGTPYDIAVFQDQDSTRLAEAVVNTLDEAGWVRRESNTTIGRILIPLSNHRGPIYVPIAIEAGVVVINGSLGQWEPVRLLWELFDSSGIWNRGVALDRPPDLPVEKQSPIHITIGEKLTPPTKSK